MLAALLESLNSPLALRSVEVAKLEFGQVLVKVSVSGICGAQLHEIRGHKGNSAFLPHLLGHEGCGIVEDVGPGVTFVSVGQKVVMHWRKGQGIESDFPRYRMGEQALSGGKVTTLSQYAVVSENRLTPVPMETPDEFAALLGCGLTTALGVVNNEAALKFGESIAVIGCGGVGLGIIQAADLAGGYPIVGIDIKREKEPLALKMGATHFETLTSLPGYVEGKEKKNRTFDVIVDTTGNPEAIEFLMPFLADSGRFVLVGQGPPGAKVSFVADSSFFGMSGKTIRSTQGGQTNPSTDIPRYVDMYFSGKLRFEDLITHRFGLSQINKGFDVLSSGTAGRVMIDMRDTVL